MLTAMHELECYMYKNLPLQIQLAKGQGQTGHRTAHILDGHALTPGTLSKGMTVGKGTALVIQTRNRTLPQHHKNRIET